MGMGQGSRSLCLSLGSRVGSGPVTGLWDAVAPALTAVLCPAGFGYSVFVFEHYLG